MYISSISIAINIWKLFFFLFSFFPLQEHTFPRSANTDKFKVKIIKNRWTHNIMEHSQGWVQKSIYNLFIFYEQEYFVICFGNQDKHFTWCLLKPAHIKQKETEPAPALILHPLTSQDHCFYFYWCLLQVASF